MANLEPIELALLQNQSYFCKSVPPTPYSSTLWDNHFGMSPEAGVIKAIVVS